MKKVVVPLKLGKVSLLCLANNEEKNLKVIIPTFGNIIVKDSYIIVPNYPLIYVENAIRLPYVSKDKIYCIFNVKNAPDLSKQLDLSGYHLTYNDFINNSVINSVINNEFKISLSFQSSKLSLSKSIEVSKTNNNLIASSILQEIMLYYNKLKNLVSKLESLDLVANMNSETKISARKYIDIIERLQPKESNTSLFTFNNFFENIVSSCNFPISFKNIINFKKIDENVYYTLKSKNSRDYKKLNIIHLYKFLVELNLIEEFINYFRRHSLKIITNSKCNTTV